jgi:hypothetical protein
MNKLIILAIFSYLLISSCSKPTSETPINESLETASTEILRNPHKSLYWGDTHLHTTNSPDAFSFGARLTPEDAYRFARGEKIESEGLEMQLDRPLDFLVVADHAEGLGFIQEIMGENPELMKDPILQQWSKDLKTGGEKASSTGRDIINKFASGQLPKILSDRTIMAKVVNKIWTDYLTTTDKYNTPGKFTSFAGYEWSSLPGGNNLHRIVMFRDGKETLKNHFPISSSFNSDPQTLWDGLQAFEESTGGKVLAIPHNGNASNGLMFALTDYEGNAMTEEYARVRARWEPVVETTQIKGDSEAHPYLSPNDEFAGYGKAGWDIGNLNMAQLKTDDMLQYEYSREALKNGLKLEDELGVNPFQFGLIGATDSHTALATADSDNFSGKFTIMVNDKQRALRYEEIGDANSTGGQKKRMSWQYLASGYAGVWAESNTRQDIWDAIMRREVFGTTGPRIQVRFFGGWDFVQADVDAADYVEKGYSRGVPMGSTMIQRNDKKAPTFMISVAKDPSGASLDRVQIIKGWYKDGKTHEKIFNVAWAGERSVNKSGELSPIESTVDVNNATYSNDKGSEELNTVWTDPEFDPKAKAFYYLRVLEIPTPRWTTYDKVRYNLDLPEEVPMTVQERAYSSPIWYSPSK